MRIPIKEVEHIARLARLRLTEEEKEKYSIQLGKILEYVQQLNELDLEDVPPTSHVVPLKNVFRKDVVRESLPQGEALRNAPQKERGYFKVPKVLG
jgi:aspartyl-tRNA(Asn)/glutamyl-tRNA(Gln) amidotransferase subunit C